MDTFKSYEKSECIQELFSFYFTLLDMEVEKYAEIYV